MKNLRKEFPVLLQNTYLNTASSGLLFDSLLEHRQEHDLDFLVGGSLFRNNQEATLQSVRQTIAKFFNSISENIILTPNFSLGLNTLLNGLDKNKKILLLDNDYPSINFAVEHHGFEITTIEVDHSLELNIASVIEKQKPDIFIFSIIQYINGILIDLDFIKSLKSKYPDLLLIADGTQFCGTQPFDFENSGIDILGCSGYKWLLGGYGNGFMLFQNEVLDKTTPVLYKNIAKDADYDNSYTSLKARFESGHLDTLNFSSLQHSLQFISRIELPTIKETIQELSDFAKKEFIKLGLLEDSIAKRAYHSSIFNLKVEKKVFEKLSQKNIITSLRGEGIRVSFHFYNTIEDIEKLIAELYRYR